MATLEFSETFSNAARLIISYVRPVLKIVMAVINVQDEISERPKRIGRTKTGRLFSRLSVLVEERLFSLTTHFGDNLNASRGRSDKHFGYATTTRIIHFPILFAARNYENLFVDILLPKMVANVCDTTWPV